MYPLKRLMYAQGQLSAVTPPSMSRSSTPSVIFGERFLHLSKVKHTQTATMTAAAAAARSLSPRFCNR